MILLVGGAAETAAMAGRLAGLGLGVTALTATGAPLDTGEAHGAQRRAGRLDAEGMVRLIGEIGVVALVDVAHPYAAIAHANAREAAKRAGIPYMGYIRPAEEYDYHKLTRVATHQEAARKAFSFGATVLLTTGSRNLAPYVEAARRTGARVVARALDDPESALACHAAGLADADVILGRGPWSVEDNLRHINKYGVGVLVTKDGGAAGGGPEKVAAARMAGIAVVMVDRPLLEMEDVYHDMDALMERLKTRLNGAGTKTNQQR